MEAIIIHSIDEEQSKVIKYILNTLNVPFNKTKVKENFYNEDFNAKMERASLDKKEGRFKAIKTENLWK